MTSLAWVGGVGERWSLRFSSFGTGRRYPQQQWASLGYFSSCFHLAVRVQKKTAIFVDGCELLRRSSVVPVALATHVARPRSSDPFKGIKRGGEEEWRLSHSWEDHARPSCQPQHRRKGRQAVPENTDSVLIIANHFQIYKFRFSLSSLQDLKWIKSTVVEQHWWRLKAESSSKAELLFFFSISFLSCISVEAMLVSWAILCGLLGSHAGENNHGLTPLSACLQLLASADACIRSKLNWPPCSTSVMWNLFSWKRLAGIKALLGNAAGLVRSSA